MAEKGASSRESDDDEDDENCSGLLSWLKAWLSDHRRELIRRMATMEVADLLIEQRVMNTDMDAYQEIRACHEEKRNERARLLLDFVASRSPAVFEHFLQAVATTGLDEITRSFSAVELATAPSRSTEHDDDLPASVVQLAREQEERFQALEVRSLQCGMEDSAGTMSLDELHVDICLLSADQLDSMCGTPGQKAPLTMRSIKDKESSVVDLDRVLEKDVLGRRHKRQLITGIAGSGKTTAFTLVAPFKWSKKGRRHACFWRHIKLFFEGTLNDPNWWKAKDLKEVFRLAQFNLSKKEAEEVIRYIRAHSDQVVLVADSLDEADVDIKSLLWQVLSGKCKELPKLNVIICSRPCKKTAWLSKHCLFHRRLEVVGFTEEKVRQFVGVFFAREPHKASQLLRIVHDREDMRLLMQTPLLATMLCRLFATNKALPSTQTDLYQSAVLAMLQQSADREEEEVPSCVLDDLSPDNLQTAVNSLCKLAYDGLARKQTVFKKSELESAGCLGAATLQTGILSSTPGINIAGHGEDMFSFPHHTMLEFFAAMHTVKEQVRTKKVILGDLINQLGVDGDYTRFWPFVSGLLKAEECESLLSAMAQKIEALAKTDHYSADERQHFLVLAHCHMECCRELPSYGSPGVSKMLKSIGIELWHTYLRASDAYAMSGMIRQYCSELRRIDCMDTYADSRSAFIIVASLQNCTHLEQLCLDTRSISTSETVSEVARVIEQNVRSLIRLEVPTDDEGLLALTPVILKCDLLTELLVGSRLLTNSSAKTVAEILHHHHSLNYFELVGTLDDHGFSLLSPPLLLNAARLLGLVLRWTQLSPEMISSVLASMTNLRFLELHGNQIHDEGLRHLFTTLRRLTALDTLFLFDVGLTWKSMAVLENLLDDKAGLTHCSVICRKDTFLLTDQDAEDILHYLPTMQLQDHEIYSSDEEQEIRFGFRISEVLLFRNVRSQTLRVRFFIPE